MQHELHSFSCAFGEGSVGEITFEHFGAAQMRDVVTFSRDEAVGDADAMSAPEKFLREM